MLIQLQKTYAIGFFSHLPEGHFVSELTKKVEHICCHVFVFTAVHSPIVLCRAHNTLQGRRKQGNGGGGCAPLTLPIQIYVRVIDNLLLLNLCPPTKNYTFGPSVVPALRSPKITVEISLLIFPQIFFSFSNKIANSVCILYTSFNI